MRLESPNHKGAFSYFDCLRSALHLHSDLRPVLDESTVFIVTLIGWKGGVAFWAQAHSAGLSGVNNFSRSLLRGAVYAKGVGGASNAVSVQFPGSGAFSSTHELVDGLCIFSFSSKQVGYSVTSCDHKDPGWILDGPAGPSGYGEAVPWTGPAQRYKSLG